MQTWMKGVKEEALLNLLIKKGLITIVEYEEEFTKVREVAWNKRNK